LAYTFKKFVLEKPTLAFRFLMDTFNISMGEAQKMIDKRRVFVEDEQLLKKSALIVGNISVVVFEGSPKGLQPIFETEDFAVFEKPSGVMMHPRKRSDGYTLNDEIKSLYGKDANAAHRIDKSTSGLVLVGKHKQAEIELKQANSTAYLDQNVKAGKTYHYQVLAYDDIGTWHKSNKAKIGFVHQGEWQLSPNPAHDEIWIFNRDINNESVDIQLFDALQHPLSSSRFFIRNGDKIKINTAELAVGQYIILISDANGVTVRLFVKV